MNETLEELINLLSLEQLDLNVFRAFHPEKRRGRLFGGQIMAQALMAASMTVPKDRSAHSLHGYFMRPGTPDTPALIKVERIRDGKSFTCLLYTSPSPRDATLSRMPSSA